jgi:hypothetical protein
MKLDNSTYSYRMNIMFLIVTAHSSSIVNRELDNLKSVFSLTRKKFKSLEGFADRSGRAV